MAATVTIDKAYFETLLRRAEFHTSGEDWANAVDISTITIPKGDHVALLRMVQEYSKSPKSRRYYYLSQLLMEACLSQANRFLPANLRDALFNAGIGSEAFEVCPELPA